MRPDDKDQGCYESRYKLEVASRALIRRASWLHNVDFISQRMMFTAMKTHFDIAKCKLIYF